MKTVKEISKMAGISVRTLQYYDKIGLLKPSNYTTAGYRLYKNEEILKLQQILIFRELEFPLKEIKRILETESVDKEEILEKQIEMLKIKRARLDSLINFANELKRSGGNRMNLEVFNNEEIEKYAKEAKELWGSTNEYNEFEEKDRKRGEDEKNMINQQLMMIFHDFGKVKETDPKSGEAQNLVVRLKKFITDNYYNCTDKILMQLGEMYAAGGEFTENIDSYGGEGTAVFVKKAIEYYCR